MQRLPGVPSTESNEMSDNSKIAPATPFRQGYRRKPETTAHLVAAIAEALYANPTMRLGQLLVNTAGSDDLFNLYDEVLIERLTKHE